MAKNDFDIDFDFEKEYGLDPKAVLNSDYSDEDFNLSQFGDDDLGIDLSGSNREEYDFDDFDLDGLDLGELENSFDLNSDGFGPDESDMDAAELDFDMPVREAPVAASAPAAAYEPEDDFDLDDFAEEAEEEEPEQDDLFFDEEEDDFGEEDELMDFSRRASFFEAESAPAEEPEYAQEPEYTAPSYEAFEEEAPAEEPEEQEEKPARSSRRKPPVKPQLPHIQFTTPKFLEKLLKLYFPSKEEIRAKMEPSADGRRRKKPTKQQIFKEFYLPTVIVGLAVVLMLSFVIGTLSNAIDRSVAKREQEELLAKQESAQAELIASEAENVLIKAEELAKGYNYQAAVDLIDAFPGELTQEMTEKRAEYVNIKSHLVEHKDPTLIPNLSFHVLIEDPARAYADEELGGLYNRNFVTTGEFRKILEQLYTNNFVLVDFDSFVQANSVDGTSTSYFPISIFLPEGKKPVMLTETMVNYFSYMIDSNDDGIADAGGAGFASRLVVDENGDIKAEYVDMNNTTQVGDYDLAPILETFIAEHPDFSYQGARATLAVSGSEGIFGYRINTATIAKKGQDYYNQEVAGATKLVEALKEKGYRIACYTFDNKAYHSINANLIQADLQQWNSQIAPVLGEVDTIVFARESDIGDYSGNKFEVLYQNGFRFMVKNADTPYAEVNNTYIRQSRLMVTGENMAAKGTMYTDLALFDPNVVLDMASRGQVPVG